MIPTSELRREANKFLKESFGIELGVPLKINNRLSTTQGRFVSTIDDKPLSVELARFLVENNEPRVVLDVLKHELVHYALCKLGKPYDDGHPVFERTLKKLDVVSQMNIADRISNLKTKPRKEVVYQCIGCGAEWVHARRLNNDGKHYHCIPCGPTEGKIIRISEK